MAPAVGTGSMGINSVLQGQAAPAWRAVTQYIESACMSGGQVIKLWTYPKRLCKAH